jgi:hypothetical protein
VAALEDAAMSTVASSIDSATVGAPAWALRMRRLNNWLLHDAFGGPRPLKFSWIINFQKGGTFLFLGALMWLYSGRTPSATSTAAWIYLAMHGTYGLTWLLKDLTFPDPNWQVRITLGSSVYALIGLGLYWTFGCSSQALHSRTTRCRMQRGSAYASRCAPSAA